MFAPLHTISVGRDFFHVPESTSSDLNAVANSEGPDGNIHKEQCGQGHLTLAVLTLLNCKKG